MMSWIEKSLWGRWKRKRQAAREFRSTFSPIPPPAPREVEESFDEDQAYLQRIGVEE